MYIRVCVGMPFWRCVYEHDQEHMAVLEYALEKGYGLDKNGRLLEHTGQPLTPTRMQELVDYENQCVTVSHWGCRWWWLGGGVGLEEWHGRAGCPPLCHVFCMAQPLIC